MLIKFNFFRVIKVSLGGSDSLLDLSFLVYVGVWFLLVFCWVISLKGYVINFSVFFFWVGVIWN